MAGVQWAEWVPVYMQRARKAKAEGNTARVKAMVGKARLYARTARREARQAAQATTPGGVNAGTARRALERPQIGGRTVSAVDLAPLRFTQGANTGKCAHCGNRLEPGRPAYQTALGGYCMERCARLATAQWEAEWQGAQSKLSEDELMARSAKRSNGKGSTTKRGKAAPVVANNADPEAMMDLYAKRRAALDAEPGNAARKAHLTRVWVALQGAWKGAGKGEADLAKALKARKLAAPNA